MSNKKILLVSTAEIIANSPVQDNIDVKLLAKTLVIVQDTGLKQILGSTIYDELLTQVSNNVISGSTIDIFYANLITVSKPYLIAKTTADFIIINNYKITDKGVLKMNDNSATNVSEGDLQAVKDYYDNLISTYKKDVIDYLSATNAIDNDNDIQITSESTGWYFGIPIDICEPPFESNIPEPGDYIEPSVNGFTYQYMSQLNKVILINVDDIIYQSVIQDNVDVKLLSKTIETVQQVYLNPLLTDANYYGLLDSVYQYVVSGITQPALYLDMMTFVKPYLINKVVAEFLIPNNYKVTNKGILKLNDNSAANISEGDLQAVKDYYDNISTTYKISLLEFLNKYGLIDCGDKDITSDATGWFLGSNFNSSGGNLEGIPSFNKVNTNPTTPYIPYNNNGIFSDSYFVNDTSTQTLYGIQGGEIKGIKLDFINDDFYYGNITTGEYLRIEPNTRTISTITNNSGTLTNEGIDIDFNAKSYRYGKFDRTYIDVNDAAVQITLNSLKLQATALSGVGSEMVVADANGSLSRATIPSGGGGVNPTSTYLPYNSGGTFADSYLYQTGTTLFITTAATLNSPNNITIGNNIIGKGADNFSQIFGTSNGLASFSVNIGYQANANATTAATQNVAIGYQALFSGITGSFNTAIGVSSMANATGNQNAALGYQSLQNSSGGFNTANGYRAGRYVTGNYNTAVGNIAMANQTSGSNNTAIGYAALIGGAVAASTSSNNTAIGFSALRLNVSGTSNVAIGYQAGESELGSNKLYIHNNNSSSPLIGGDFSTRDVIINSGLTVTSLTGFTTQMVVADTTGKLSTQSIPNVGSSPGYYLSASDNTIQGNATADTPRAVKFNTIDLSNGFSLVSDNASFVGTINNGGAGAGTTLTVTSIISGSIRIGMVLTGGSVTSGTYISGFLTGTGLTGTYQVSVSQNITSTTFTASMASKILVGSTGIYNIQFSSQMDKADAGVDYATFWLRRNGIDITNSAGVLSLQGNSPAYMMAAWNYVIELFAGNIIELYWASSDNQMQIFSEPAQTSPFTHPGVQSTILTITQQAGIISGTGITAINNLSSSVQTLNTGTTGSDFNIVSSISAHTFNIPDAGASARGLITTGIQSIAGQKTFLSSPIINTATASSIAIFGSDKSLVTANATVYPSLTELTYVKGVTSAIQTQIDTKQADSAWVDCSSQATTGWASTTVKLMQYKLLGSKTMIFQFRILGTGSGTTTTITLPFTSSSWGTQTNMYRALNTTTQNTGVAQVGASSATLTISPSSNPASVWTDAAVRQAEGTITINLA
jgi:hypothetical protein